ncbi:hypothetical protein JL49_20330 [Pseudoalteromonas luteoviolacea]|uniref:Uncharacterized protein n=1 Tax=Pseudoalteromonas luteoviolacea NCIMB 1942 TaxID=1365253 RepID=A0A167GGC5_9GAMM|nr:hypothetical protein N482_24325 [Pseudoalteromonas luteoviolacea NCIMB 1942]KZW98924.1 hypothetical protein JL49_20330 [Pseudoalteromonas luteoviolacea]
MQTPLSSTAKSCWQTLFGHAYHDEHGGDGVRYLYQARWIDNTPILTWQGTARTSEGELP